VLLWEVVLAGHIFYQARKKTELETPQAAPAAGKCRDQCTRSRRQNYTPPVVLFPNKPEAPAPGFGFD
jgi:hypothetical protein